MPSSVQVTTTDLGLIPMSAVVHPRFDSTTISQMCPLPTTTSPLQSQCSVSMVHTVPQQNTFPAVNPATIDPISNPTAVDPTTINVAAIQQPMFSMPEIPSQARPRVSSRRFEVEDVAEVDSPNTSDLSAHSSTENLERDLGRTEDHDVATKTFVPATDELESTSGSSIGIEIPAPHMGEHHSFYPATTQMMEHAPFPTAAQQMVEVPFFPQLATSHMLEHPPEIPLTSSHMLEHPRPPLATSRVLEQHPQLPLTTSQTVERLQLPVTLPQMAGHPPGQIMGPTPIQMVTSHMVERPPLYAQTELPRNLPMDRPQVHTWHHPAAASATHTSILGPVYHQPGHPTVSDPGIQAARQCLASVGYVNTASYCPSALLPISESHFRHSTSSVPDLERVQYLHQNRQRPEPTVHVTESYIHTSDSQFHPTPPSYTSDSTFSAPSSQPLQGEAALVNFPHANLLSHAFMRFIHSMSMVLRDPAIQPLLESLDQRFTQTQAHTDLNPRTSSHCSSPTQARHTASQVRIYPT